MNHDKDRSDVRTVALEWFRMESGLDNSAIGPISVGTTISCVVWQGISAILHYCSLYDDASVQTRVHHLPIDASRLRRYVAEACGEVILDGPPTGELKVDEQYLRPEMLTIPKSASVVRQLQRTVRSLVRRRDSLYVTDWVTARWSRDDPSGLVLYRKSLLKSAIPAVSRRHMAEADLFFPHDIDDLFSRNKLEKTLSQHGINWSDTATSLIVRYVTQIYTEIRHSLVLATSQFLNMLDFYAPSKVYLPADAFEPWIILYQLCKARGIETHMCVDGYMCLPLWPALRDNSGQDWLVDRALAYGSAQREHICRTGFPVERIELTNPPFLKYQKKAAAESLFDVIVLTWVPYTVNPHANYSSPPSTLAEALKAVADSGLRRVGVKIKSSEEEDYVRRVATEVGTPVTILSGRFYSHAQSSPLFIGGISTALAEAVALGARYIVFEPIENGYTDEMICQSSVISRETIARTGSELREAIGRNSTSWVGDVRDNLYVS